LGKIDKIYLRDPISYDYLNKMGLKNIGITDDLALLPLAKQEIIAKDQKYITYCPSELIYRYAINKERSAWININLFILEEILKRYPDKKIVLLAHVLRPEHASDKIIVNELYNLISQNYGDRVIIKNNSMLPYEVRNYIQQSIFTVSSRMHPVISSLQCEIPAIAFSYSAKYWGIIGERYGLKDYILDVRFLEYEEMKNKFTEVIKKLEDNYEKIQESLKRTNKLAEDRIIKMLKDIALYCEDRKVNNNF